MTLDMGFFFPCTCDPLGANDLPFIGNYLLLSPLDVTPVCNDVFIFIAFRRWKSASDAWSFKTFKTQNHTHKKKKMAKTKLFLKIFPGGFSRELGKLPETLFENALWRWRSALGGEPSARTSFPAYVSLWEGACAPFVMKRRIQPPPTPLSF